MELQEFKELQLKLQRACNYWLVEHLRKELNVPDDVEIDGLWDDETTNFGVWILDQTVYPPDVVSNPTYQELHTMLNFIWENDRDYTELVLPELPATLKDLILKSLMER